MLPRKVCADIFGAFRKRKCGLWANAAGMWRSLIQRSARHRRNSTSPAERCSVLTTAVVPSYYSSRSLMISPLSRKSFVIGVPGYGVGRLDVRLVDVYSGEFKIDFDRSARVAGIILFRCRWSMALSIAFPDFRRTRARGSSSRMFSMPRKT